ncbi:hypothetical protein [Paraburkholderia phosphatilytica]|uniref:hypothetical protein n=1 Tax=Paraburkholderia phosphatilytica TaxID=2282883 RepID=UPI000F5FA822|nr:hypothetical protein [Paraburkholderia phosphatilytica]
MAGQRFLVFPVVVMAILVASLLGVSAYQENHLVTDKRAMLAKSEHGVSVIGHEIGATFDIPECQTEGATASARHYAYIVSGTCFKHLDGRDAGKPLSEAQLVWLEQLDLPKHYPAVGLSDSVCAGVVDGKLEAIVLRLRSSDGLEANARSVFGSPESEVTIQPRIGTLGYFFSRYEWRADNVTTQIVTSFVNPGQGGHGSPIHYAVIAYAPDGKGLVGEEWQAPQSRCALR